MSPISLMQLFLSVQFSPKTMYYKNIFFPFLRISTCQHSVCNGHGICDKNGQCMCDLGWSGTNCTQQDCCYTVYQLSEKSADCLICNQNEIQMEGTRICSSDNLVKSCISMLRPSTPLSNEKNWIVNTNKLQRLNM